MQFFAYYVAVFHSVTNNKMTLNDRILYDLNCMQFKWIVFIKFDEITVEIMQYESM